MNQKNDLLGMTCHWTSTDHRATFGKGKKNDDLILHTQAIQFGSSFLNHLFHKPADIRRHNHRDLDCATHQEIGEERIIHYNHGYMFYVGC